MNSADIHFLSMSTMEGTKDGYYGGNRTPH